jgi:hypothetical protein
MILKCSFYYVENGKLDAAHVREALKDHVRSLEGQVKDIKIEVVDVWTPGASKWKAPCTSGVEAE